MELIKLTKTMEKELQHLSEIYEERVGYLTYTRNYYHLENDKGTYVTNEPVTFKALNAYLKGESYAVSVLDKEEAEQALSKKATPRKKATASKEKETPAQDKKEVEKKSESKDEKETESKDNPSSDSDE